MATASAASVPVVAAAVAQRKHQVQRAAQQAVQESVEVIARLGEGVWMLWLGAFLRGWC